MNIADILQRLGSEDPVTDGEEQLRFPRQALAAAKAQWDDFWPAIEQLMQQMTAGEELSDEQYQQLFFGVLLLADVADLSKAPAFFAWVNTEDGLGSDLEYTLGDALTEDLPSLMYILSGESSAPLLALLHSEQAGEFVKSAALSALFAKLEQAEADAAAAVQAERRAEVLQALPAIIEAAVRRGQSFVLSEIAIWCLAFGVEQFKPTFQTLLRQNKLDLTHVTSRQINQWRTENLQKPLASELIQPTFDIESISQWVAFQSASDVTDFSGTLAELRTELTEDDAPDANALWRLAQQKLRTVSDSISDAVVQQTTAVARPSSAVGRNDPCPCGSGKKYKKCCLA